MNYIEETCSRCSNERYIVNKTHKLCHVCNRLRLDEESGSKKKVYKIKPMSKKRILEQRQYVKVRETKRKDQIEGGYYKCYFCNEDLLNYTGKIDAHHTLGRDNDNLMEYKNIFFAHRICHTTYHSYDAANLFKTTWYLEFLMRIRRLAAKSGVWEKELDRCNKAGILDIEDRIDSKIIELSKRKK